MAQEEQVSRRQPGFLPNIQKSYDSARQAITAAKSGLRDPASVLEEAKRLIRILLDACYVDARQQAEFNRKLWGSYNSLPAKHGSTHKGGGDTIHAEDPPPAILFGLSEDAGTPQLGYTPQDAQSDTIGLLAQTRNLISLRF